ncbi:MAG: DUF1269 domain-containing protein [Kineosporiaceae bacterium]
MTTFTVWKFDTPDGAEQAAEILKDAEKDNLVKIVDHAVVSWPQGASKPDTKIGHEEALRGTGWGAFWGLLIGVIFFIPVIGGLAGAAIGAFAKLSQGTGITKEQLETIRTEVTEGTSALFAVTEQGDLDRLGERFHGMHQKLVDSNLTEAERKVLLDTFGD